MQLERLFGIVYILIDKKRVTARELAKHFEVSSRTILRDIDTLCAAGIPVYTMQGKGGGVFMMENYILDRASITDEEQNQLLFALKSMASSEQVQADSLLAKLRALFNKTDTDWIEVDFSPWGDGRKDKGKFELLKQSIMQSKALQFSYASSYGRLSKRRVYPLKLVFKSSSWYLQAYCTDRQDYRTFKVNRIQSCEVSDERFTRELYKSPPINQINQTAAGFLKVKVELPVHMAFRVYDEFWPDDIERALDGGFIITTYLPDSGWLYSYLLSFGPGIKVLEPSKVKETLINMLDKMKSGL